MPAEVGVAPLDAVDGDDGVGVAALDDGGRHPARSSPASSKARTSPTLAETRQADARWNDDARHPREPREVIQRPCDRAPARAIGLHTRLEVHGIDDQRFALAVSGHKA